MCNHKRALAEALMIMELERDDVLELHTAHDPDCGIYYERCCDCRPRISLKTTGGAIEINEHGELKVLNIN